MLERIKGTQTLEQLREALEPRLLEYTRPFIPPGAYYLKPGPERSQSGSHYTPCTLTEPIVRACLEPVPQRLARETGGAGPTLEQILSLKVSDPAMGSGAFLVEACRQLAQAAPERREFEWA